MPEKMPEKLDFLKTEDQQGFGGLKEQDEKDKIKNEAEAEANKMKEMINSGEVKDHSKAQKKAAKANERIPNIKGITRRLLIIFFFSIITAAIVVFVLIPAKRQIGIQCKLDNKNQAVCGLDEKSSSFYKEWIEDVKRERESKLGEFFSSARFDISIVNKTSFQLTEPYEPFLRRVSLNCEYKFDREYQYGEKVYEKKALKLEEVEDEIKKIEPFLYTCVPTYKSLESKISSSTTAVSYSLGYEASVWPDIKTLRDIFIASILFIIITIPVSKEIYLFLIKGRLYFK